jgi:hypothetical protein
LSSALHESFLSGGIFPGSHIVGRINFFPFLSVGVHARAKLTAKYADMNHMGRVAKSIFFNDVIK